MSEINWTDEQSEAINIRKCDTLVSAAAGSGKTAVLVERVIRMITDEKNPVDIDKILVVTFTNAAAAQMKEKISAAIAKEIEKCPENRHLRNQLLLLGGADIRTYDSFCQNIVKENFQKTDLPIDFGIIQKTEEKLLRREALDETFNEFYEDEERAEAFVNFADSFSGRDDTSAEEFIYILYDFLRTMPYYNTWIKKCSENADFASPDNTVWGRYLKDRVRVILDIAASAVKSALALIDSEGEICGVEKYRDTFTDDAGMIKDFASAVEDGYFSAVDFAQNKLSFSKIPAVRGGDAEAKDFIKHIRDYEKELLKNLKDDIYYLTQYDVETMMRGNSEILSVIADTISVFDKKYSQKKLSAKLVDFGDISHKCVEILTCFEDGSPVPSDVALKLRSKYCEILVDEYQDTNNLQEHILNMISGSGKKFFVGDIKQSIYKFRNSKPELFLEKYRNYSAVPGENTRRLLLTQNFRSFENILSFVNFVFEKLMCTECGGLDYSDNERLNFSEIYPKDKNDTEIFVFDKEYNHNSDTEISETEHYFCASKIRNMVDDGFEIWDGESYRACRYSDFTVLLRKKKSMQLLKEKFDYYGIPSYVEISDDYSEKPIIKLLLSLFRIIDNPRQDIELAAVLRSELFGFTDDELVDIRLCDREADFYTCLTKYESEKKDFFFGKLDRWRSLSKVTGVYELINTVFDEMLMYTVYPEDMDVLRTFVQWGKKYEQTSFKGLFRFITYLQKQLDEKEDMGSVNFNIGDCVTIMTIHKSKGLENNIVILAEAGGELRLSESKSRFVYDDELGIAADYTDTDNRIKYKSLPKIAIEQKIKADSIAEEMRLLYVALTRAKQKLIITGTFSRTTYEKKLASLYARTAALNTGGFAAGAAMCAKNYLDWIISALTFHPKYKSPFSECCTAYECNVSLKVNPDFSISANTTINNVADNNDNFRNIENCSDILSWKYPYNESKNVPSKLSVSEIKRRFYSETQFDDTVYYPKEIDNTPPLAELPQFMKKNGEVTAAMLGTAYHSVLQYLDFHLENYDNLSGILDSFEMKNVITSAERSMIDINVIKKFLNSEIFFDIRNADRIYKEYSFIIPFDSSVFYENTHEEIMVQGIIDCLYIKDSEFYIVDYKSDSYSSTAEISGRYRTQLLMYMAAVEKKFGKNPKSAVLYMLKTGEIISL